MEHFQNPSKVVNPPFYKESDLIWGSKYCNPIAFHLSLSKRNLTFNLLDPNQIRLTLRYTNIDYEGWYHSFENKINPCGLEPQLIKLEFIIYLPKLKVVATEYLLLLLFVNESSTFIC